MLFAILGEGDGADARAGGAEIGGDGAEAIGFIVVGDEKLLAALRGDVDELGGVGREAGGGMLVLRKVAAAFIAGDELPVLGVGVVGGALVGDVLVLRALLAVD